MKKLIFQVSLILACGVLSAKGQGVEFYVSTGGDDQNPGSKQKPVATLTAARDLVRNHRTTNVYPNGGYTVWVDQGVYQQDSAFELNYNDSGETNAPITWRAEQGEEVILTGGYNLDPSDFAKVSAKDKARLAKSAKENVVVCDLKKLGITNYGKHQQIGHALPVRIAPLELFINDEPQILARYPNEGYVPIGKVIDAGSHPRVGDYSERGAIFQYTDPRHEVWAKSSDVWFQGTFSNGYADDKIEVEYIDPKTKQVKLRTPHMYAVKSGSNYQRYVVLNVLEELDQAGEWYLDRESGKLYVWSPVDIRNAHIMISQLEESVVCVENVSNVIFRDFIIEGGRGIGLYMEGGNNNLIAGCTVRNVGNTGIVVGQGARQTVNHITHDHYLGVPISREVGSYQAHSYKYSTWNRNAGENHKILSCDIYNTGSGGILLGGGDKRSLTPGNNVVENCKIHTYNRYNKFTFGGIMVDGCGNKIRHNEIYNSDFHGVFCNGPEHLFEYNNIHHVNLNSGDVSAWYMGRNPSNRGIVLRYNYFHDCGNPNFMSMGIYCDDSSTGVTVFANVFYNMFNDSGVVFSNSGWDISVRNNIIIKPSSYAVMLGAHYYTWYRGGGPATFAEGSLFEQRLLKDVDITKPPYSERYPLLSNYMDPIIEGKEWEGMRARRNVFSTNLIVDSKHENPVKLNGEHAQFESVNNLLVDEDPGFVDYAKGDFTLESDSPVFKELKGFQAIPFSEIGLFKDEYRTEL